LASCVIAIELATHGQALEPDGFMVE